MGGLDSTYAFKPSLTHKHKNRKCPLAGNDKQHIESLRKLQEFFDLDEYDTNAKRTLDAKDMLVEMELWILPRLHEVGVWKKYRSYERVSKRKAILAAGEMKTLGDDAPGCGSCNSILFCYLAAGVFIIDGLEARILDPPDNTNDTEERTLKKWKKLVRPERYTARNITIHAKEIVFGEIFRETE